MPEQSDPSDRPARRYSLALDVEADDLDVLRKAAARAISRLELGAPTWTEEGDSHRGELTLTTAPDPAATSATKRAQGARPIERTRREG